MMESTQPILKSSQTTFNVAASISLFSSYLLVIFDRGGKLDLSLEGVFLFILRSGFFVGGLFAFGSAMVLFIHYWFLRDKSENKNVNP